MNESPDIAQAIARQHDYEQLFLSFDDRHYIRAMRFCQPCNGTGCERCNARGWRHTKESIAFGRGLNGKELDVNPYNSRTQYGEFMQYHAGTRSRIKAARARIRAAYGLKPDVAETEHEDTE